MTTTPEAHVVVKPIVSALDMEASIAFYKRLGFGVTSYDSNYAWVTLSGSEILHIRAIEAHDGAANHAALYVHVQDVGAWRAAWAETGVDVGPIVDQPWQMREFVVIDPSGTTIRVGQNL